MARRVEEELRKLSFEVRFLEQTAEALRSRISMVSAVIADLTYANMALDGLEKEGENSKLLVPIGGNSYIETRLENPDKIIVGMGAGVSVEKKLEEAKQIVQKRLEGLEKTNTSLQQQFSQVAEKINEDRGKLENLAVKLQKGKPPRNV